jgi:hypothetical protein
MAFTCDQACRQRRSDNVEWHRDARSESQKVNDELITAGEMVRKTLLEAKSGNKDARGIRYV